MAEKKFAPQETQSSKVNTSQKVHPFCRIHIKCISEFFSPAVHNDGPRIIRISIGRDPNKAEHGKGMVRGAVVRPVGVVVLEDDAFRTPSLGALHLRCYCHEL